MRQHDSLQKIRKRSAQDRRLASALALLVALGLVFASTTSAAKGDRSQIRGTFVGTGVDSDAEGDVKSKLKAGKGRLQVKLKNLSPDTLYDFVVGGIARASFTTDQKGSAKLRFDQPAKSGPPLDFDPRGEMLCISDGVQDVLTTVLSGAGGDVREDTVLSGTDALPSLRVELDYRVKKDDGRFDVEAEGLPAGDTTLFVGGIARATMTPSSSSGKAKVRFVSSGAKPPKELPLDFDPEGADVELVSNGTVVSSGEMRAQIEDVNSCTESSTEVAMAATAAAPAGSLASLRSKTDDDCEREFRVRLENAPDGAYDVVIDGVQRGTLVVDAVEDSPHLDFSNDLSDDDDPEDLPLDFDPSTAVVEIFDVDVLLFSGTGDTGAPVSPNPMGCDESELRLALLNVGPDGDASGDARLRVDDDCRESFDVEAEDLPEGVYDVSVGGIVQAALTVARLGTGEIEGEVSFDSEPDGDDLLLDFDPRGQLIEVSQGGTVYLSRTFE